MLRRVLAIAWFTLLEGVRTQMPWLAGALVLACIALAEFTASIALTETNDYRLAMLAGGLRLGTVFLVASFVVASSIRELHGGAAALYLSRPLSRAEYFLGRLLGHKVLAGMLAAAAGGLVAVFAPPDQAWFWACSLGCELVLIATFALFCAVSFKQMPAALGAVTAFYLLARAIGAIQLLSVEPLLEGAGLFQHGAALVVRALGFLLPDLWRFADAGWLLHATGHWLAIVPLLAQTVIYCSLLIAMSLFDWYRKAL